MVDEQQETVWRSFRNAHHLNHIADMSDCILIVSDNYLLFIYLFFSVKTHTQKTDSILLILNEDSSNITQFIRKKYSAAQ